jgi:hypothetical protein
MNEKEAEDAMSLIPLRPDGAGERSLLLRVVYQPCRDLRCQTPESVELRVPLSATALR